MSKLQPQKEIKVTRKGYDCMPADASSYERTTLMKEQIKKLKRKSPDISKMYSVTIPDLKISYYFTTSARAKSKSIELEILYPGRIVITKKPQK